MLKTTIITTAVLCLGVGGALAQQDTTGSTGSTGTANSASDSKSASSKSDSVDAKFVREAAMGGLAEVQLGQIAAQRASSDEVKKYGQQMVDDHGKANDELKQIASQKNIDVPSDIDKKHKDLSEKLQKASGAEFDKEYMKAMIRDHHEDIELFEKEAKNGQDPELKAFAQRSLAVLHKHHDMARMTEKDITGKGAGTGTGSTMPSGTGSSNPSGTGTNPNPNPGSGTNPGTGSGNPPTPSTPPGR